MLQHTVNSLTVSVVMCTYNGGRFLKEQLDSIVNQTYPIKELIIQDDGSSDNTEAIARSYASRYGYIHFYRHEGKPGINRNFFSAMARATGDLIAIADQDDIWEADKLAVQVAALGNNWLVGGLSRPFSDDGSAVLFDNRLPNLHLLRMMYVGMMPGHTQVFRRELLDQLPANTFFMYDLQTQAWAAATEQVAYVPRVVVNHRRHQSAATYNKPVSRQHSLSNIWNSVTSSLKIYRQLRPFIRQRFAEWLDFLSQIPYETESLRLGKEMAELQVSQSFTDRLRLVCFCIRHRQLLFHVAESRPLLSILRGAFFPISCTSYYKYILNDKK